MAVTKAGAGSDYGIAYVDSKKQALHGSKTYKLHLPPKVPVNDFWAVTVYDSQTRSLLQTSNPYPTLGSQTKGVQKNADGSFDVYFGPTAPKGKESNWLEPSRKRAGSSSCGCTAHSSPGSTRPAAQVRSNSTSEDLTRDPTPRKRGTGEDSSMEVPPSGENGSQV
jgi:hypothetical protein